MQDIFTRIFYCEVLSWKSSDNEFLIEDDPTRIFNSGVNSSRRTTKCIAIRIIQFMKNCICKFSFYTSRPANKSIHNKNDCKSFFKSNRKECSPDPRCPVGGIDDIDI